MFESFAVAFTTFFAVVGPLDVAAIFAALTANTSAALHNRIAARACIIAAIILVTFAFFGQFLFAYLGVSLASFKIAGGVLLLLISIDMVFAKASGGTSTTAAEADEALLREDVSVFPLAMPLIAGPGAMGAAILLTTEAAGAPATQALILVAMLLVVFITYLLMRLAGKVEKMLGVTGIQVISRIFGILLAALAVQFIVDGLVETALFS